MNGSCFVVFHVAINTLQIPMDPSWEPNPCRPSSVLPGLGASPETAGSAFRMESEAWEFNFSCKDGDYRDCLANII